MKSTVKNPGKVFARVMRYVAAKYKLQMILVLICIVVNVLCTVRGTLFLRTLIDGYIAPLLTSSTPDYRPLSQAILQMACIYGVGVASVFVREKLMIYITQGTLRSLRNDLFAHMETLPLSYFDRHERGDIMSVYTNDIDTLRQMISQSVPQLISSSFTIVSTIVSMFILSVPLTLITLGIVFVMLMVTGKLGGLSGKNFVAQQAALGAVNGYVEEMMAGQKVVKVFNHEEQAKREFRERNNKLFASADAANRFANVLGPINLQIGNSGYVVIAIVGGILALRGIGGFTVGALASFLTFNRGLNMPINQVSVQFNSIVMAIAGADRIFRLMDEPSETDEGDVTLVNVKETAGETPGLVECEERTGKWAWKVDDELVPLRGDIVMDHVDFGYVPEKTVLHDIELYAHPGQKIAFVGSTGAGKTTVTNLLNRFYDIQDGKIRYDGIDINRIKKGALRRSLGMVLQDTSLFTGTVKENIRFGRLDATDEEIVAAAKLANADSFIRKLEHGYDTVLSGNGAGLSQGQRQLLAIARAAVADPPVLILDEATSSIDTRTERIVQEGMDHLMTGRTTFVIAHRLSTVRNADCIMVLENGRIIERGTHEQLMEVKGRYYQLQGGTQ